MAKGEGMSEFVGKREIPTYFGEAKKLMQNDLTLFSVSIKIKPLTKCLGEGGLKKDVYDQSRRKRIYRQRAAPF